MSYTVYLTLEEFEENSAYQRLVKQITYKVMMYFLR